MATDILKAEVAIVQVGHLRFEGLLLETGDFAIAQQQVASIFQVIPSSAPKWLKRLLPEGSSLFSVKTNREKIEGKRIRSAESAIALKDFERVLRKLDKEGNKTAEGIVDQLVGLSLHQLFCDTFKVRFESEDRQAWLIERQDSKDAFWEIGKAIKAYKERHPELSSDRKQWLYSNVQNNINRGLFGKTAKTIREELGVKDLLRDNYGRKSLRRIDHIQSLAASLIEEEDIDPCLAVQQALESFKYKTIGYCE